MAPPRQLRGMWLTTVNNIDWPSQPGLDAETVKAEYQGWLDLAQRLNHNAIFVHVRPSGDAFWPSQYAPWSEWLTGKRDGSRSRLGPDGVHDRRGARAQPRVPRLDEPLSWRPAGDSGWPRR